MKSVKLQDFREKLIDQLNESYPDYKINEYFNTEYSAIQWLRVSDVADNAKVLTIAEVIAVEKFTSRDDETNLLVIDYVNSDSRRFTNIPAALSFMSSILKIASDRKKEKERQGEIEIKVNIEKTADLLRKQQENLVHLESLRADEIKLGTIDPTKLYLVGSRHCGKIAFYQYFLKQLFGFKIKEVIFNDPATIVFWEDGEKTIVRCQNGEEFDPEKGLAMAISKKIFGNKYDYYDVFKKFVGRYKKKKFREALDKAMEITPDEITRNGHRYVLADNDESMPDENPSPKEETVIANLTLSEVSLDPGDAAQILKPYCDIKIDNSEKENNDNVNE